MHAAPEPRDRPFPVGTIVLAILAAAYLVLFFRVTVQNNPTDKRGEPITRWRLATEAVGPSLVYTLQQLTQSGTEPAEQIDVGSRPTLVLLALLSFGAALGIGLALLRLLQIDRALSALELGVFAAGSGLVVQSLVTLGLGLVGCLYQGIFIALALAGWVLLVLCGSGWMRTGLTRLKEVVRAASVWTIPAGLLVGCFLLLALMGTLSPPVDFDVLEYHLGGPKEFFTAGCIRFLPHNVYTSFPFSVEMLLLGGMVLRGSVVEGALVGKVLVGSYTVLTALALWALGRRYFPPGAGALAALFYLTTPWVYRITVIAYVDGALAFYVLASLLAFCVASDHESKTGSPRAFLLVGAMAGGAICCKYTGAAFVAVPIVVLVFWHRRLWAGTTWRPDVRATALSIVAVLAVSGPWFLKNAVTTGNPTYPLLYRVFDGDHWDAQRDARWVRAHTPQKYTWGEAWRNVRDFALRSDWASALLFVFVPGALLATWRWRAARLLWLYVAVYAAVYFYFTHRIDRFYVPVLSVFAALSGLGAYAIRERPWRACRIAIVAAVGLFNLGLCTTGLAGYNALLFRLDKQTEMIVAEHNTSAYWVNHLPRDAVVLLVGEARPFYFERPVLYNTVFDTNRFSQLARGRAPAQVWQALGDRGITHVLVNWSEVRRYREPHSYGYDPFVRHEVFAQYVRAGVLRPVMPPGWTADQVARGTAPLELYEVMGVLPASSVPGAPSSAPSGESGVSPGD